MKMLRIKRLERYPDICEAGMKIIVEHVITTLYAAGPAKYPSIFKNKKREYLHRFLYQKFHGREIPKGLQIDHIDRDNLNCRLDNLRLVTRLQNTLNHSKVKNTKTRFKGVYFHARDKKFAARIRTGGLRRTLGYFDTDVEAARAYDLAAKQIHGSICTTNQSLGLYDQSVNESSTS